MAMAKRTLMIIIISAAAAVVLIGGGFGIAALTGAFSDFKTDTEYVVTSATISTGDFGIFVGNSKIKFSNGKVYTNSKLTSSLTVGDWTGWQDAGTYTVSGKTVTIKNNGTTQEYKIDGKKLTTSTTTTTLGITVTTTMVFTRA